MTTFKCGATTIIESDKIAAKNKSLLLITYLIADKYGIHPSFFLILASSFLMDATVEFLFCCHFLFLIQINTKCS
jgi:hypothetical protein